MCKAEPWNEGYSSPVTWKELAWQLFFIRVITRVHTRICTWFQLRLQFVLGLENKKSKKNKEKNEFKSNKNKEKSELNSRKISFFCVSCCWVDVVVSDKYVWVQNCSANYVWVRSLYSARLLSLSRLWLVLRQTVVVQTTTAKVIT